MKPQDTGRHRGYTTVKREQAIGNAVYSNIEMRFHGGSPPYNNGKKSHVSTYTQQPQVGGYSNYPTNEATSMYYYDGRQSYDTPEWNQNQPTASSQQWQPPMEDRPMHQHTSMSYGGSWEQGSDNYATHQAEMERLRKLQEERMRRYEREKAQYYGQHGNY